MNVPPEVIESALEEVCAGRCHPDTVSAKSIKALSKRLGEFYDQCAAWPGGPVELMAIGAAVGADFIKIVNGYRLPTYDIEEGSLFGNIAAGFNPINLNIGKNGFNELEFV